MTAPTFEICPVCSGPSLVPAFQIHGFALRRCQDCGLRYLDPQPDDEVLAGIYTQDYFIGERTPELEVRVSRLKQGTAGLYLDALEGCLGRRGGTLLELGCGEGDFLVQARQRGWETQGLDISVHCAARANERLGVEAVQAGVLEQAGFPAQSVDVVACFDVIEHVRDPLAFLRRVYALLRPGGVLCAVTPCVDSLSARVMGRLWMEYKVEHLYYFSRLSLSRALERTGFVPLEMRPNRKVLDMDYICLHFVRCPVPGFSPLFRGLRACLPEALALRPFSIPAGGVLVMARKPSGPGQPEGGQP